MDNLLERYAAALGSFLVNLDEDARLQAYDLGRTALAQGAGILDVVNAHHHALKGLIRQTGQDIHSAWLAQAEEFLAECLGPFEMSHRGYQEANEGLRLMNEVLLEKNRQISQANEELEAFSYSVAHDLRAPLRQIAGLVSLLLSEAGQDLSEKGRRYLTQVRDSAKRMGVLLENMLDLARFARAKLKLVPLDLAALARAVMERVRQDDPAHPLDFKTPEHLPVRGDASLLEALLENLLANAWKYSGRRDRVVIELGFDAAKGAYFVRDNGAGFDMGHYDKLFKVFNRLHTAAQFEGTGVGLAIVQRIVERHGGRVWAEARVDEGATFYFTLPEGR